MGNRCKQCGNILGENAKFCGKCGTAIKDTQTVTRKEVLKIEKIVEYAAEATATGGEVVFMHDFSSPIPLLQVVNPIKHLLSGFGRMLKGFGQAIKDKKKLIPAIIIGVIWVMMTLLPLLGVDMSKVGWLSWLTFAQGGLRGGITGMLGGVIGKGILAYFFMGIIINVINKQNPFKTYIQGAKKFFSSFAFKNLKQTALFILGMGISLIVFNFITWNASSMNSMAGVAAFFLALRSMSGKYGFLKQLVSSLITQKGNKIDMEAVNRLMGGWTIGFAFGTALSLVKYRYIGYTTGGVVLIVAMVLFIVSSQGKGAVAV